MDNLEILYDHYKDTFNTQLKYVSIRDKQFISLLVLVSILIFYSFYGLELKSYLEVFVQKGEISKEIKNSVLEGVLLFSILWVEVLYFKSVITVDRGNKYLHKIEKQISGIVKDIEITREGKFYIENRTTFSKSVGFIYKYIFPLSIPVITLLSILFSLFQEFLWTKSIDIIIWLLILYVSLAFIFRKS